MNSPGFMSFNDTTGNQLHISHEMYHEDIFQEHVHSRTTVDYVHIPLIFVVN